MGRGTRITTWHRISEWNHFVLMHKPGWCGFADMLHFTTVGHTTRLFHRYVNMAISPNILLRTCQECSAVRARPRCKIRTLEIANTWFATIFPSLHVSIFCQTTEFCYGLGLMGHSAYSVLVMGLSANLMRVNLFWFVKLKSYAMQS
jgi:hypothetical protein